MFGATIPYSVHNIYRKYHHDYRKSILSFLIHVPRFSPPLQRDSPPAVSTMDLYAPTAGGNFQGARGVLPLCSCYSYLRMPNWLFLLYS